MEISPQVQEKIDQVAKLPKAARFGIIGVIAVAIASGYFFLFYQENAEELKALHAQELELQRKLSEVRSIAANISAFEAEIEDLEIHLKTVLRQLPNNKELEVLLTDISNLGKTAGVEIRAFKRGKELSHDFYAEVPIDLELTGEFHDVARFFELVSKLPRIVNMGSLNIKVVSEDEESTVLSVKGTATTFRFVGKDNA
jgi:type IV pilus assembly protein PilO